MDGEDVFQQYKSKPPSQKRSFIYSRNAERIRWALGSARRSPVLRGMTMLIGVAVAEGIIIRLVYGKDHPINRFTWRRMEGRGELSPELLNKKKTMDAYMMSTFSQLSPTWINIRSNRNIDYLNFGPTNFD